MTDVSFSIIPHIAQTLRINLFAHLLFNKIKNLFTMCLKKADSPPKGKVNDDKQS